MTKAFHHLPCAGAAFLCFAVSGGPLPAVAQSGTAISSFEITSADTTIDFDIAGDGSGPALYTNLTSITSLLTTSRISGGTAFGLDLSGLAIDSFDNAATGELSGLTGAVFTNAQIGTLSNSGRITGDDYAIYLDQATVYDFSNAGTLSGERYGVFGTALTFTTLSNTGHISASDVVVASLGMDLWGVYGASPPGAAFTNAAAATISGSGWGARITGYELSSFTNHGTIEAKAPDGSGIGLQIDSSHIDDFLNGEGGLIKGTGQGLFINASSLGTFVNEGVIEGGTAISNLGLDGQGGLTITNTGTISSTVGGTAIDFDFAGMGDPRDDMLILEDYAVVAGDILFGRGYDTLDVSALIGGADLSVSDLEEIIEGDRIVLWSPETRVTVDEVVVPDPVEPPDDSDPDVPTDRVVIIDPTTIGPGSVAQSTAGVVQGLAGLIGSQAMSAGYSGSLMSPAAAAGGSAVLTALDIGEGERPRLWGDVFGYSSNGPAPAQLAGLAIGADTQFGGMLSAGALLSYSQSAARFSAADTLASRTGVAGFYGTWHAGVLDVGFSLLGGLQAHESGRRITTAAGIETATGSFGGVFAAPGASAALPLANIAGTAVALRASATYVVGVTSGYTETGSSSNLTVGPRPITSLDARLGLEARHAIIAGSLAGEGVVRAGTFGLINGGGASVPVSLFGQTVNVATTAASVYGVYVGTGAVANLSETVRFELNADTAARTDGSLSVSLRGGLSGTF